MQARSSGKAAMRSKRLSKLVSTGCLRLMETPYASFQAGSSTYIGPFINLHNWSTPPSFEELNMQPDPKGCHVYREKDFEKIITDLEKLSLCTTLLFNYLYHPSGSVSRDQAFRWLVVKIRRTSPNGPESFQSLTRVSMGSKPLILSTRPRGQA